MIVLLCGAQSTFAGDFSLTNKVVRFDDEKGSVTTWIVQTSRGAFSFMPPVNWRISSDEEKKTVLLVSQRGDSLIKLRFDSSPSNDLGQAASLKSNFSNHFPQAKILEEFQCHAALGSGNAIDAEVGAGRSVTLVRFGLLPSKQGAVEVLAQSASSEQFETAKYALTMVLNSLEIVKKPGQ